MIIKDDRDATTRAKDTFSRWERAMYGGHTRYIENAKTQERYFKTQQWTQDELDTLATQLRPALTLNHIYSAVQIALGIASKREMSVRYLPVGPDDDQMAKLLSRIAHQILDKHQYPRLERQMLMDSLVLDGRGYLDVGLNYDNNTYGEVALKVLDPLSVVPDPDAIDEDPDSWTEVFIFNSLTLDQITEMYGKDRAMEAKDGGVQEIYASQMSSVAAAVDLNQAFGGNRVFREANSSLFGESREERENRVRGYRVIERQWRCFKDCYVAIHPVYGDRYPVPISYGTERDIVIGGEKVSDAELWAYTRGLVLEKQHKRMVRKTTVCGHVLLADEWSKLGDKFSVIPLFPTYRRGEPVGLIRSMLSPQDLLNKSVSQMLHDVNLTANSGWLVPRGSLMNITVDELEQMGSRPGTVIEYNPEAAQGYKPEKIMPNQVPTGLASIADIARLQLKEISGIGDNARGMAGERASGSAIGESIQATSLSLQSHVHALRNTREHLGRLLLHCIRNHYTQHRIIAVAGEDDPTGTREQIELNQMGAQRIVNDPTIGQYDLRIGDIPARDTYDQGAFSQLMELANAGIPIPPWRLIQLSSLPQREELAEEMKKQAGMAEPSEEEMALMQQQSQIELESAKLALDKAAAEVHKVEAEAALAEQKGTLASQETAMQLQKIRKEYDLSARNLKTRMAMSNISAERQRETAIIQQQGKIAVEAMKLTSKRNGDRNNV